MGLRFGIARAIGAASTWCLTRVFSRPAANFPGKAALYADPALIRDLAPRIRKGSVVVVGTNGKTTVTNLLADAFEAAGEMVACNRTGANLDSGVATALLHAKDVDRGVFESDELWLAKVLPGLAPDYVVLLNLFRDQLDRVGEIDRVQEGIAGALAGCPATTLVYNADDPFCQAVADRIGNPCVPFGIDGGLGLAQNAVADSGMCQRCDAMLAYEWRQYGQLGKYRCPSCGFARAEPAYAASDVRISGDGASFDLRTPDAHEHASSPFPGAYMVYNALAVFAAADLCGLGHGAAAAALASFEPGNGRLQRYEVDGRCVLLNLAKNPAGFNQNLRIALQEPGPKAIAFFVNDREADGRDVSWLWDIDFQELAGVEGLSVFAGGLRRHDVRVRLKYAGIDAPLVDGAADFLAKAGGRGDMRFYLIANYTALPSVKAELDGMRHLPVPVGCRPCGQSAMGARAELSIQPRRAGADVAEDGAPRGERLVIAHVLPSLLNLYGDGGNVTVLANRAHRRGVDVEVVRAEPGCPADWTAADIVFVGGGPDREQRLASRELLKWADDLRTYVADDGVLLAICGGFQLIGREWILDGKAVEGLGLVDVVTRRAEGGSRNRLVGDVALDSPLADMPVIGYENHAGRTFLGSGCEPFGRIVNRRGKGNDGTGTADGVLHRNVVGTYLHGPLLAKNPEVADWLVERALARRAAKEGRAAPALPPLDDECERAANAFMGARLGL